MSDELVRFSVAVPSELLSDFDALVERRGVSKNRSEAIRDLIRLALVEEECDQPGAEIMGTLTIVYNHHTSDLKDKLDAIQHSHFKNVISTMHVHLDQHNCLETIVLRGTASLVQEISNRILGTKGVKTGKLVRTTIEGGHGHSDRDHHHHH